jgi:hypothetical protein
MHRSSQAGIFDRNPAYHELKTHAFADNSSVPDQVFVDT